MKSAGVIISVVAATVLICFGGIWSYNRSKPPQIVVLAQMREFSSAGEPPSTGSKFYHLKGNHAYHTARLLMVEAGKIEELGSYRLEADGRDEYATVSFFPERGGEIWWAWCWRGRSGQRPVHQGPVPDGWRLANASRSRSSPMAGNEVLIDTIYFMPEGEYLKLDGSFEITGCTTMDEVCDVSRKYPSARVAALVYDKSLDGQELR